MINSISIQNFRCYSNLQINNCRRINVIVGENGSGKTALLESIFLPLASGPEVGVRLRQLRGLDTEMQGPQKSLEEDLWGDFFFNNNTSMPISLALNGDGPEARSLSIFRGAEGRTLELLLNSSQASEEATNFFPFVFRWQDAKGKSYEVVPRVTGNSIKLPNTGEDLPNFFFFPSNANISAQENAARFSALSKVNNHRKFVELFRKEYQIVTALNVEVHGGTPVIFATVNGAKIKVPLPNVSSGLNRIASFMLAIASSERSVILIDEIENGIYFRGYPSLWRSMLNFLKEYKCQAFISTHSHECLTGLIEVAGDNLNDIALWRTERIGGKNIVRQFAGDELKAAIEYGQEVR